MAMWQTSGDAKASELRIIQENAELLVRCQGWHVEVDPITPIQKLLSAYMGAMKHQS